MDDLKSCPFCRSKCASTHHPLEQTWSVSCDGCSAVMPYVGITEAEAIANWNTRAAEAERDALKQENERLKSEGLWDRVAKGALNMWQAKCRAAEAERDALQARLDIANYTNGEWKRERDALKAALEELVSRFDRRKREWILSGDDSKALHYARKALATKDTDNG